MEDSNLERKTIREAILDRQENLRAERLASERIARRQVRDARAESRREKQTQQDKVRKERERKVLQEAQQRAAEDTDVAARALQRAIRNLQATSATRHSEEGRAAVRMLRSLNDALSAITRAQGQIRSDRDSSFSD
jgi:hypothetical protein